VAKSLKEIEEEKQKRCKDLAEIAEDVLRKSQAAYWVRPYLGIYTINVATGESLVAPSAMVIYSDKNKIRVMMENNRQDAEELAKAYKARKYGEFTVE